MATIRDNGCMTLMLNEQAVWCSDVGVVRVSGHERLSYLHSLLSQHLEDSRPGACADWLYLDHKANPLFEGRAVVRAPDVLLIVDPAQAGPLAQALERFKFLTEVSSETMEGWSIAKVRGTGDTTVPGMRSQPMTAAPHGPGMVIHDRSGEADLLGPDEWLHDRVQELALPQATAQDWTRWRVANGVAGWQTEIVNGRRPQELGLLSTHVHLRKGCYPGQETVAKTWNLGRPRRALAIVDFDHVVTPGDAVDAGGKSGLVTSSAPVGDDDAGSVALALLPVDRDGALSPTVTVGAGKGAVRRRVGEGESVPGA